MADSNLEEQNVAVNGLFPAPSHLQNSSVASPSRVIHSITTSTPQRGSSDISDESTKDTQPETYFQMLSDLAQTMYENHYKGGHRITVPTYHLAHIFGLSHYENELDKWTDDRKSNAIKTEAEVGNLRKVLREYGKSPNLVYLLPKDVVILLTRSDESR